MSFFHVAPAAFLAGGLLACSYGSTPVPRDGDTLKVVTTIQTSEHFPISGVARFGKCNIAIIGANWGTLGTISESGSPILNEHANGFSPRAARLFHTNSDVVLGLSGAPNRWALVAAESAVWRPISDSIAGALPIGTTAMDSDSIIAFAPFGQQSDLRRRLAIDEFLPHALIWRRGVSPIDTVDMDSVPSGTYGAILNARKELAIVADTIWTFTLQTTQLRRYERERNGQWRLLSSITIPKRFPRIKIDEGKPFLPWIFEGGPMSISYVPEVVSAGFSTRERTLYLLRPMNMVKRYRTHQLLGVRPLWRSENFVVERFTMEGHRTGIWMTPTSVIDMSVDTDGNLYFRSGLSKVIVARGSAWMSSCAWPQKMILPFRDVPPQP